MLKQSPILISNAFSRVLRILFALLLSVWNLTTTRAAVVDTDARDTTAEKAITQLARVRFKDLRPQELELFRAVVRGESITLPNSKPIRPDRLRWLCIDKLASQLVGNQGIHIAEAVFSEGDLDLSAAEIRFPISLERCDFTGKIILTSSVLELLDLTGAKISGLDGDNVRIQQGLALDFVKATGTISLKDATISGCLSCSNGSFLDDYVALNCNGAHIIGGVSLVEVRAIGRVDFGSANIEGYLRCGGGHFDYKSGDSLSLNAAHIGGSVHLDNGFTTEGKVNGINADIGGNLTCTGGQFDQDEDYALCFAGAEVRRDVFVDHITAKGMVDFTRTRIHGNFAGVGSEFNASKGETNSTRALEADSIQVDGAVFLGEKCTSAGTVDFQYAAIGAGLQAKNCSFASNKGSAFNLSYAVISGYLLFDGSKIIRKGGMAIFADHSKITGDVKFTDGFSAIGCVSFLHAQIGGDLVCDGGKFDCYDSKNGSIVLDLGMSKIEGSVLLRPSTSNLLSLPISKTAFFGALANLENGFDANGTISFAGAKIAQTFWWDGGEVEHKATVLRLENAKVGTLLNGMEGKRGMHLPKEVYLHGFVYDSLHLRSSRKAIIQLEWLKLEPQTDFFSQPYQQLAETFRTLGLEDERKSILIAENEEAGRYVIAADRNKIYEGPDIIKYAKLHYDYWWYRRFGELIGFGYQPSHALFLSFAVILVGIAVFKAGYEGGLILPVSENAYGTFGAWTGQLKDSYPKFNSIIYSIETFIPLVKFGVDDHWMVNANKGAVLASLGKFWLLTIGGLLRGYLWLHIAAGWVLTSLWVGALTGLIKA
jgi:hypothetical protein